MRKEKVMQNIQSPGGWEPHLYVKGEYCEKDCFCYYFDIHYHGKFRNNAFLWEILSQDIFNTDNSFNSCINYIKIKRKEENSIYYYDNSNYYDSNNYKL